MSPVPHLPGLHVLADLYEAEGLTDPAAIESVLRQAALAAGATILFCRMHAFPSPGGVTGVVLLAESHISIHTWPERAFAAVDVFMCGESRADEALRVIAAGLGAGRVVVRHEARGALLT